MGGGGAVGGAVGAAGGGLDGGAVGGATGAGAVNPPPGVQDAADADGFHSPALGFMFYLGDEMKCESEKIKLQPFL